jgi:formamidopyrimidine-DNA glycosylase
VHAQDGQPCRRCRHIIEKVKWSNRSAYYCPGCQV